MSRPLVVVSNVIYNEQGRLLIGKHKDGHKENLYAFPGGKVEEETLEECFWRELTEETGLRKPDFDVKLKFLGFHEVAWKERRFLIMFYAAPYYAEKMGKAKAVEPHKHQAPPLSQVVNKTEFIFAEEAPYEDKSSV